MPSTLQSSLHSISPKFFEKLNQQKNQPNKISLNFCFQCNGLSIIYLSIISNQIISLYVIIYMYYNIKYTVYNNGIHIIHYLFAT